MHQELTRSEQHRRYQLSWLRNRLAYSGAAAHAAMSTVVSDSGDLVLSGEQDRGRLLGTGDWRITGNELGNVLRGNAGNNTLEGGAGDDWLNSPAMDAIYSVAAYARVPCARGRFDAKNRVCKAGKWSWRDSTICRAGAPARKAARSPAA